MRYCFEDFELDMDRYRLERSGELVPVEPRVLELLAYLVSRHGEVVSKQELLDSVWDGQVVSESALNRCVYEARRALGDDGKRLLVTVHGRGYRFAGVLQEGGTPVDPSARIPSRFGPRAWWLVPALLLIGAVVALFPHGRSDAPASAPPPSPEAAGGPVRLAILPVQVAEASDREMQFLGIMLGDLLATRLGLFEGLIVRPPEYASEVLDEAGSLQQLAREVGVTHVLSWAARHVAESGTARLDATLHSFPEEGQASTAPLGSFRIPLRLGTSPEDLDAFVRVRDAVAEEVVRRLTPALQIRDENGHTPRHPDAYRMYLRARSRIDASHCEGGGAQELLRRAVELDPEFALAWELLAVAQYNRVWACGTGQETYSEARRSATRASVIAPELQTAGLIEVLILVETGALEDAYERVLEIRRAHPDHPLTLVAEAYVLRYAGYVEISEDRLRDAFALDPLVLATDPSGTTPNALLYQNELEEFLALTPGTDTPYHRFYRGFAEYLRGEEATARALLEPAFRRNPSDLFARFSHALLATIDGEPDAAKAIVREVARQRRMLEAADGEITYKQAQLFALAGEPGAALDEMAHAVEQGFFPSPYFRIDPVMEPFRGDPRFEETLSIAEQRHEAFGRRFGLR